jgi:hypothetical protein
MESNVIRHAAALCPLLLVLALVACGSSDGDAQTSVAKPEIRVSDLSEGSYVVSIGDQENPTVGKYYAGADGNRLLIVEDETGQAKNVYRRNGAGAWTTAPAAKQNVNLQLLSNTKLVTSTLDVASLAGSYVTRLSNGAPALFSLTSGGDVVAGSTPCKLSGKATASTLPGTFNLNLSASGCGELPSVATGAIMVDSDYAPARFRIVTDDGTTIGTLLAFSE